MLYPSHPTNEPNHDALSRITPILPHHSSRGRGYEDLTATIVVPIVHRVFFTSGAFDVGNELICQIALATDSAPTRVIVFIDQGVAAAWPALATDVAKYAQANANSIHLVHPPYVIPGGESAKNGRNVYDTVVQAIEKSGICRHSFVFAIGGGAMLDVVGFAASTAHRGVRLVRFPTTTLAQGDAGVGVKNGINMFGKKNFLGCFAAPWAVVNDQRFLATLSDRDWRAGIAETVKVALLKDPGLFSRLEKDAANLVDRDEFVMTDILRRTARLHVDHIAHGGDPFEGRSTRPLDFGHWSAHKLEQLSEFRIKHGEGVAIGIALDSLISVVNGYLCEAEALRILKCLAHVGLPLYDELLQNTKALYAGAEEFREHLGGRLTITLLQGVGMPVEVHQLRRSSIDEAVRRLATWQGHHHPRLSYSLRRQR